MRSGSRGLDRTTSTATSPRGSGETITLATTPRISTTGAASGAAPAVPAASQPSAPAKANESRRMGGPPALMRLNLAGLLPAGSLIRGHLAFGDGGEAPARP